MLPGELVDERFLLGQETSAGGMGRVFQARDRRTGEPVALKVLIDGPGADRGRFAREARALAELRHPGIVRHVAHGQTRSGEPYLAMEWLDGEDLARHLRRAALRPEQALTLAARAAEALGAAHARGIVHRDLKPSNIFLVGGRPEEIRLLDFGIAHLGGMTRLTAPGAVLGTPGYMAPEQARDGESIGPAADVFSLGCVLFECLTGKAAFSGGHVMALLAKILFEEAPRLSEHVPDIPAALDDLVARMLSKEPAGRPPDGAALAAELSAIQAGWARIAGARPSLPRRETPVLTGDERRVVTVLFIGPERSVESDSTVRSEPLAGSRDHAEMRRVLSAHGGALQLLPDASAIGAILDAPGSAKDQAARAARCALSLAALRPERRVVLSSGRVDAAGKLGLGSAAERAARLLPARSGGAEAGIAIDDVTAGLLDARFEVEVDEAGTHWLRGEHDTLSPARLLLGKRTPCVGRDLELSTLGALWAECQGERRAALALVTGPAGMGKSRLAQELVHRIRQRDGETAVWTARVDSMHSGSPFGLLGQALRGALGLSGGEPIGTRRSKLRARLSGRVPAGDQQRVAEFLGEIVGAPFPDDDSLPLRAARRDAQLMADHALRAWLDFLRAEAAARPVLLVLEDLHWGDLATVGFVDAALRELPDLPWMVLALARPEVHDRFPRLWAERGMHRIQLQALARKASEELVRRVLGREITPDLRDRIIALAGGNAFYLEELIRAVAHREDGALPETVLAMVQSRIEGLPPEARRVLRAASVFGEVCWQGGIEALLGAEPSSGAAGSLDHWLSALVEREVLVGRTGSRFEGERQLAFRHALLREGAYSMLTEQDQELGHRLAGEWLEAHGEDDALVLAEHFERGRRAEKAAGYYLRAAERTSLGGDTAAAVAHARRGLDCGPSHELRIALLGRLCEAHTWRMELVSAALPWTEELLRITEPSSDAWGWAMFAKIAASLQAGRVDAFMDAVGALLALGSSGVADAVGPALGAATVVLDQLGQVSAGNAVMERLLALGAAGEERAPLAAMWQWGMRAAREAYARDAPHYAMKCARTSISRSDRIGHQRISVVGRLYEGMNLFYLGAFEAAARLFAETVSTDEESAISTPYRRFCLAWMLADRGMLAEARAVAGDLAASGRQRSVPLDEGKGRWVLAEVLCRQGSLEEADREAQAARTILELAAPLVVPGALATLASIRLAEGRPAEARAIAEEAFSKYAAMGACGMFRAGYVRLVHAECLGAAGDHDAARAAIRGARDRILGIAAKIDDPEYRQSFLEAVPENARTLSLAERWSGQEPAPRRS